LDCHDFDVTAKEEANQISKSIKNESDEEVDIDSD